MCTSLAQQELIREVINEVVNDTYGLVCTSHKLYSDYGHRGGKQLKLDKSKRVKLSF